jgi:hypothetical protein
MRWSRWGVSVADPVIPVSPQAARPDATATRRPRPLLQSLIAQVELGHKPATQALVTSAARALRVDLGRLTGQQ